MAQQITASSIKLKLEDKLQASHVVSLTTQLHSGSVLYKDIERDISRKIRYTIDYGFTIAPYAPVAQIVWGLLLSVEE